MGADTAARGQKMKIAVLNQKGGSGKTTTTLLLAEALKSRGRVLIVDCDPQGGASTLLLSNKAPLFSVLMGDQVKPQQTRRGFDILTADHRLDKIAFTLGPYELDGLKLDYDYILYDCPPTVQGISRAAAITADKIFIPADISIMSIGPTLYTLKELKSLKKSGQVLLIGKAPREGQTGFHADIYQQFKEVLNDRHRATIPRTATAQKAAAGFAKLPKAINNIIGGLI